MSKPRISEMKDPVIMRDGGGLYWAEDSCGYVSDPLFAGVYEREYAAGYLSPSYADKSITLHPVPELHHRKIIEALDDARRDLAAAQSWHLKFRNALVACIECAGKQAAADASNDFVLMASGEVFGRIRQLEHDLAASQQRCRELEAAMLNIRQGQWVGRVYNTFDEGFRRWKHGFKTQVEAEEWAKSEAKSTGDTASSGYAEWLLDMAGDEVLAAIDAAIAAQRQKEGEK